MVTVCGVDMVELNVEMLHGSGGGVCVGYVFCISVVFCHLWIDRVDFLAAQCPSLVLSSWGWPWLGVEDFLEWVDGGGWLAAS
jgi:hypothetical protein